MLVSGTKSAIYASNYPDLQFLKLVFKRCLLLDISCVISRLIAWNIIRYFSKAVFAIFIDNICTPWIAFVSNFNQSSTLLNKMAFSELFHEFFSYRSRDRSVQVWSYFLYWNIHRTLDWDCDKIPITHITTSVSIREGTLFMLPYM